MSAKIETPVEFPLFLDMSRYTRDVQDGPLSYELFGVVCHQGSINTGHYTCMMKSRYGSVSLDKAWVTSVLT
jgi:ubiquitin carboxyl-terminal hydrolase 22/27/51